MSTAEKSLAVGSFDWVRSEVSKLLNHGLRGAYWYVLDVFADHVIVEMEPEAGGGPTYYRFGYTVENNDLVLEEPGEEVTLAYVIKSQIEARGGTELTGPFVVKDSARQIAYAPVLVPGEPDSDGETLTAEKVEQVAHEWMVAYRNIDRDHTLNNLDASPVESYLLPMEMAVKSTEGEDLALPVGTWVLATKFASPDDWEKVTKGEWAGYSIMGVSRAAMKSAAPSRTLLADLGDDWLATHVSVVDRPAVPKSKWFALKSDDNGKRRRLFSRRPAVVAKEGKRFSAETFKTLEQAVSALNDLLDAARSERAEKTEGDDQMDAEAVKAAVAEALAPVQEQLGTVEDGLRAVKEAAAEPPSTTEEPDDTDRLKELEDEIAALKTAKDEEVSELRDALDAAVDKLTGRRASKRARGQDSGTDDPSETVPARDSFGRRLRS